MIRRRLLQEVINAMGNINIGSQTPDNNILNMFYALENGTAVTGEFSVASALSSGEHAIFETGLEDINGLCIINESYDGSTNNNENVVLAIAHFTSGELNHALTYLTKGTAAASFLSRCSYRIENGALYVTPTFGSNTQYTPFAPNTVYRWIAW